MAAVQRGQQRLLWRLLERMYQWSRHAKDEVRLPSQLRHHRGELAKRESADVDRAIVDYVAGLSDHQAVELDRLLDGGADTIVRGFVV